MFKMIRRILNFAGDTYKRKIRTAYIFSFLKSVLLTSPIMISIYVIEGLINNTLTVYHCLIVSVIMLCLLGLIALFQNISDRLQSTTGFRLFCDKRIELSKHLRSLHMGYFTSGNIGKISSVLSQDMIFIEENSMNIIADTVTALFKQFILISLLFSFNTIIGCTALGFVLIALIISNPMTKDAVHNSFFRQKSLEDLTSSVLEYTEGLGVSRSFGKIGERSKIIRDCFKNNTKNNINFEHEYSRWDKALLIIYGIGYTSVLTLTILFVSKDVITTIDFISILMILLSIFNPVKTMLEKVALFTIMDICLTRIENVFKEEPIQELNIKKKKVTSYAIEFDNVCFSYDEEEVLHHISFKVSKNQMVALVGQSGCGKTTIANLIARFWDVSKGNILINGENIKNIPLKELMNNISMVFQSVYLFEDTILNNIIMGKPNASIDEVIDACKKARCYDFINALPFGFDTVIGEGGSTLSGGEKQRISIARCILKDAPIIILDEATASMDADNEYLIQQALNDLCKDKTTIVIAHRLNTIKNADKIIVIKKGSIKETGTHDYLLSINGEYAHMISMQSDNNKWK